MSQDPMQQCPTAKRQTQPVSPILLVATRCIAIGLFFILLPLFAIIALLVAVMLGRPVLFTQWRAGYQGRPFKVYKFRTMTNARGPDGELLPDDQRLTAFGRWLRSTSLDELPQLFNIIKGDMVFIGPRPQLLEYLPLYTPEQARRHEVYPGITGWAQVNGRNSLSWEEKFAHDVWYVDHRSFWLDWYILMKTIFVVLKREGIHQEGQATVAKFTGSQPVSSSAGDTTVSTVPISLWGIDRYQGDTTIPTARLHMVQGSGAS